MAHTSAFFGGYEFFSVTTEEPTGHWGAIYAGPDSIEFAYMDDVTYYFLLHRWGDEGSLGTTTETVCKHLRTI